MERRGSEEIWEREKTDEIREYSSEFWLWTIFPCADTVGLHSSPSLSKDLRRICESTTCFNTDTEDSCSLGQAWPNPQLRRKSHPGATQVCYNNVQNLTYKTHQSKTDIGCQSWKHQSQKTESPGRQLFNTVDVINSTSSNSWSHTSLRSPPEASICNLKSYEFHIWFQFFGMHVEETCELLFLYSWSFQALGSCGFALIW